VLGYQTKNQLPPEEEPYFAPGSVRRLFSVRGVQFGIAICHEGWRYPETVRWAAARGAKIVFHPNYLGGATPGEHPDSWGMTAAPYYEKAMVARAGENSVYFASVNYALPQQDAATSLIGPAGDCLAHTPYGGNRCSRTTSIRISRPGCSRRATSQPDTGTLTRAERSTGVYFRSEEIAYLNPSGS
jgi:predicted amidohydrolase